MRTVGLRRIHPNSGLVAVGLALASLIGCGRRGPELPGRLLILSDGDLLAVRRDSTETIARGVKAAALSPNRQQVAVSDSSGISLLDLTGNNVRRNITSQAAVEMFWSPNGSKLSFKSDCRDDNAIFVSDLSSEPKLVYQGTAADYEGGVHLCGLLESHWVTNEHLIVRATTIMASRIVLLGPPDDPALDKTFIIALGTKPTVTESDKDWEIWRVCATNAALVLREIAVRGRVPPSSDYQWSVGRFEAKTGKIEVKRELPKFKQVLDNRGRFFFPVDFYDSDCNTLIVVSGVSVGETRGKLTVLDASSFSEHSASDLGGIDLASPLLALPDSHLAVLVLSENPGHSNSGYDVTVFDVGTGRKRSVWRKREYEGQDIPEDRVPRLVGWLP